MAETSLRLTNNLRRAIKIRAIDHAFAGREAAFKAAEDVLAHDLYAMVFPAAEIKTISKAPKRWFQTDSCLRFNVGGFSMKIISSEALPVPYCQYCRPLGSISDEAVVAKVRKHFDDKQSLKDEKAKADRALDALLFSSSTVKRLLETWPEGKQFCQDLVPAPAQLPSLVIGDLNKMLGLAVPA